MLTYGILTPHPPAIIPAIGEASAKLFSQTITSLLELSARLKEHQPDTIVILSSHGELQLDRFIVRVPEELVLRADFSEFGISESAREYTRDRVMTAQLIEALDSAGLATEPVRDAKLDYGAAVPLHYLASGLPDVELVNLGISLDSAANHTKLGQAIRSVADESGKKVVVIASMELAHLVSEDSPHGYHPAAADWDRDFVKLLEKGEQKIIQQLDPFEIDEVGGQQYRGVAALLGAVEDNSFERKVLSYEAPGGIGCCVASWERITA